MSERSYPYPVVGNRDDVPGADFQATIQVAFDGETAFINVEALTSSETLLELIRAGLAIYALHIECSNTLYRAIFRSPDPSFRAGISLDAINDTVEVLVTILAIDAIPEYRVAGQHSDYGEHS
ncbi:MAG: hypothetical protein WBD74_08815, partial [Candidatus Aquilonibacter sp.]